MKRRIFPKNFQSRSSSKIRATSGKIAKMPFSHKVLWEKRKAIYYKEKSLFYVSDLEDQCWQAEVNRYKNLPRSRKMCHFVLLKDFWAIISRNVDDCNLREIENSNICGVLGDLVSFLQFTNVKNTHVRVFLKVTLLHWWVFLTLFKLYKWYQITQRITYSFF